MTRFNKFLYLLQPAVAAITSNPQKIVDHLALVFDPNIHSMIEQDTATPVEQKVQEYIHYLQGGKKPYWLTTGEQT